MSHGLVVDVVAAVLVSDDTPLRLTPEGLLVSDSFAERHEADYGRAFTIAMLRRGTLAVANRKQTRRKIGRCTHVQVSEGSKVFQARATIGPTGARDAASLFPSIALWVRTASKGELEYEPPDA